MLHAKTAVVDSRWVTAGTFNLDARSLLYNLEVNAMILDEGVARDFESMFEADVAVSETLSPTNWPQRSWLVRVRAWMAWQFRRWL